MDDDLATTPAIRTFLVERYWPGIDEPLARTVLSDLERAARAMTREGTPVDHVVSILMPGDQVVFSLFQAPDEPPCGRSTAIDGNYFFDLFCGMPARTKDASITAAQPITGRLP